MLLNVVLEPVPVVVTPSFLVNVHVPDDGNPFNTTLPLANAQVGCVIVPTTGAGGTIFTVKAEELVAVPPALETLMPPVVASTGKVAVICVALFTVYDVAETPLNLTADAPVKLVPVIITDDPEPEQALLGVKLVIVSGV